MIDTLISSLHQAFCRTCRGEARCLSEALREAGMGELNETTDDCEYVYPYFIRRRAAEKAGLAWAEPVWNAFVRKRRLN